MTEVEQKEQFFDIYEELLAGYLPEDNETKELILAYFRSFPELPHNPKEAFAAIHRTLLAQGFEYDNGVFMLEDVIAQKRGNCLGLSVLFGTILKGKGYEPLFEVAVNPKDAHYANDIKQFERLMGGEVFSYDALPELPTAKAEFPQNWFAPLEHPIIGLGDTKYETTTLLDEAEDGLEHKFGHESSRPVTLQNLLGSLYTSKAKVAVLNPVADQRELVGLVRKGLSLWPEDRQGWLFARDLGMQSFDDKLIAEAEDKYIRIGGNDSLYHMSMYEITGDESHLSQALALYPAYVEAYIQSKVRLPLPDESAVKDAKFDLTAGAICVSNSTELSLEWYYLRNLEKFRQAFGTEYMAEFLYDLELDEKMPVAYYEALYTLTDDTEQLLRAYEHGALQATSPYSQLYFCLSVIHAQPAESSPEFKALQQECSKVLQHLQITHGASTYFQRVLGGAGENVEHDSKS
jgi:hypothetical protein